MLHTKHN